MLWRGFPERNPIKLTTSGSIFVIASVIAGVIFFSSLDQLWPLVSPDVATNASRAEARARFILEREGFDLGGYHGVALVVVDASLLDFFEGHFRRDEIEPKWLFACANHEIEFKKENELRSYSVTLSTDLECLRWRASLREEDFPDSISASAARSVAEDGIRRAFGIPDFESLYGMNWSSSGVGRFRQNHTFSWTGDIGDSPLIREHVSASIAGSRLEQVSRSFELPQDAERILNARSARHRTLAAIGELGRTFGAIAAFLVALAAVRSGRARPRLAGVLMILVFLALTATQVVRTPDYFRQWNQFAPQWLEYARIFLERLNGYLGMGIFFFVLVLAADAVDRERTGREERGATLWKLLRGKIADRGVAIASVNGFLVGLLCGGVMTLAVFFVTGICGGRVALQPRGFFLFGLNATVPSIAIVSFFFFVAVTEEVGYRYFGTAWIARRTGRNGFGIWIPAVVYGLAHANYDFLPPAEPFWARAFVMTLVGAVWGWAFLRFDALTVILSHYTADLFIFTWPWMGSGEPWWTVLSVLTVALPLAPALVYAVSRHFPGDEFKSP